jgi:Putative mono-oxygenase ydhR
MNHPTLIPRSFMSALAVLALSATSSTIATGQTIAAGQPVADAPTSTLVAVVVKIPIPPGLARAKIVAAMEKQVPKYKALPGLVRKYFTLSDDQTFGGIYLWKSREIAEAYYNDAWRAGVLKRYGAPAEVTYFDVPIAIEGSASP